MAKVPARIPKYSAADLWPPGSKGVEFPPAAFHPVYLGNFLCHQYDQLVPRVQQYFASKGLLARMVFSRSADSDPFRSYQDRTKLYDCLVYFSRPEDAQDAVTYLHRDKYFGHRLNIFPGRIPDRMDPDQSVLYLLSPLLNHLLTRNIEDHIQTEANVAIKSSRRISEDKLAVQFDSPDHRDQALRHYPYAIAASLKNQEEFSQQQRFLEQDVFNEMRVGIENDETFMAMCPEEDVLESLYAGVTPDVDMDWFLDTLSPVQAVVQPTTNLRFKIAKLTLQDFGVVCKFFVGKMAKHFEKYSVKRIARAGRPSSKKPEKKRKAIQEEYDVCNVKLPWQTAMNK